MASPCPSTNRHREVTERSGSRVCCGPMGDGVTGGISDTTSRAARGAWRVRVRSRGSRRVIGSGVLLGGDTVLTCAHVLGSRVSPVTVDFPEIEGAESSTATVIDGCWVPPQGEDRGDVALLRLHRPPPGRHSAPLLRAVAVRGTRVDLCGYADSLRGALGVALTATVNLSFGERVQLDLPPSHLPRRGFSGGPVLDMDDPPSVLGITVARYLNASEPEPLAMAHMIPVETIARYLPGVRPWVGGLPAVQRSLTASASSGRATDFGYAERLAAWFGGRNPAPVYVTEVERGSGRDRTLQRALALADRELSVDAPAVLSTDPAGTVPPVGSLDLAVGARGATADEVVVQVAERMNLKEPDPARARKRLRAGRVPLTVAVLGVNESAEPDRLLGLCGEFAERGCRLLLVFHGRNTRVDQATEEDLALRHRMGALAERLDALDGRLRRLAPTKARLAGVEPPDDAVTDLHMNLSLLRHAHGAGGSPATGWTRTAQDRLDRLDRRTRRAERDTAAAEEAARRGYERRTELRGELRAYRQMAVRHGRIEDVELDGVYRAAHEALYRGRFAAESAAEAVAGYVDAVRHALGWPPQDRAGHGEPGAHGGAGEPEG
ncbi:trypsin-like peptidase domain-containing protein, partial [Streptomyces sp. URMC 125]|uniref:trypsin-like peptidase domain-containing protein n=1 Tax=Streptomyces sp. URMC 125 TaxID=3423419 RepID=UPI003F1AA32C